MIEKRFLIASDFDYTLSRNETGQLLSHSIGVTKYMYKEKIAKLRKENIVQFGGELAYLITNDEDYKGKVTKDILKESCKNINLKDDVKKFIDILQNGFDNNNFSFHVISAGPEIMVKKFLNKILPSDNIYATKFKFDQNDTIVGIERGSGGQAKVDILNEIIEKENIPRDRVIYVGDGSSDYNVMLHVSAYGGYPIAVRFKNYIGHISKKTIVSQSALAVLIPILQDILKYDNNKVSDFFEKIQRPLKRRDKVDVEFVILSEKAITE